MVFGINSTHNALRKRNSTWLFLVLFHTVALEVTLMTNDLWRYCPMAIGLWPITGSYGLMAYGLMVKLYSLMTYGLWFYDLDYSLMTYGL